MKHSKLVLSILVLIGVLATEVWADDHGDDWENPTQISLFDYESGKLDLDGDVDMFRVYLHDGFTYHIVAGQFYTQVDMRLFDASGTDEVNSDLNTSEPYISFQCTNSSYYYISLQSLETLENSYDSYELWVGEFKAPNPGPWQRQTSRTPETSDYGTTDMGYAVALTGDTMAVGMPGEDSLPSGAYGYNSGKVAIYGYSGSNWYRSQEIEPRDNEQNDRFGYSVGLSDSVMAVGAPYDSNTTNTEAGSAYIYELVSGSWEEQEKVGSDLMLLGKPGEHFGQAVAASEDTVVIGAPRNSDNGTNSGAAYVFTKIEGRWRFLTKFTEPAPDENNYFGSSVAIDDDTMAIGADFSDVSGPFYGAVYVYKRTNGSWYHVDTLTASDGSYAEFGSSIDISQNKIVVGAPRDNIFNSYGTDSGSAYVFAEVGGQWIEEDKLTPSWGIGFQRFGDTVAIDKNTVVVGNGAASRLWAGITVFRYTNGSWEQTGQPIGNDTLVFDRFGWAVDISGNIIAAGAPKHNGSYGKVYTFLNRQSFQLIYEPTADGDISGITTQTVAYGEDGSGVLALPDPDHHFVQWSDGSTENIRQDTGVVDDINTSATFAAGDYTLFYHAAANGSISGATSQTVAHDNDGTTVTAVPDPGYHFVNWDDGSIDNPRQDTTIRHNISGTAMFEPGDYNLTYIAGNGGTVEGTDVFNTTVAHGDDGPSILASSSGTVDFLRWSDGSTDNPRTDLDIKKDLTVTAIFTLPSYYLEYTAGTNGSLTGPTTQTVVHGLDGAAVTAVADYGYHFAQWSDGVTDNPRTDLNVTGDISVEAQFEINSYTLTYLADANGSVTEPTSQTVEHGSDGTTVTAVPNTDYHFVRWSDGYTSNPRQDTNVTENTTVTALFEVDRGALQVNIRPHAAVQAGARWREVGTSTWHTSGYTDRDIPAGWRYIEFKPVSGYLTPSPIHVHVAGDETAVLNADYDIILRYASGANGWLQGVSWQLLSRGEDGTPVEAFGYEGYEFWKWSDGSTENPRTDLNVQAAVNVTALFRSLSYLDQLNIYYHSRSANFDLRYFEHDIMSTRFSHPAVIKIRQKPGVEAPDDFDGVYIDGPVKTFVTDVSIGELYVRGKLDRVVAIDCHIGAIHAHDVGRVQMMDTSRSHWSRGAEENAASIYSGGDVTILTDDSRGLPYGQYAQPTASGTLLPRMNNVHIRLVGVSLNELIAPDQRATILMSNKKFAWTDDFGFLHYDMSLSLIPDLGTNRIEVGHLDRLSVYGGGGFYADYAPAIGPPLIQANARVTGRSGKTLTLSRGLDAVISSSDVSSLLMQYSGSTDITTMTARADMLSMGAIDGDLLADRIQNDGMIYQLMARDGQIAVGTVKSGADQTVLNPHILRIIGDLGVEGNFWAGVDPSGQPANRGNIKFIYVNSNKAPTARIAGEAEVQSGSVRLIGDDDSSFLVNP